MHAEMPKIVLDANALMMPFEFNINLDSEIKRLLGECEIVVPSGVVAELTKLSETDRAAKAGLRLAGKYRTLEVNGQGDDAVIEAAVSLRAAVVTNDDALLRRLREMGIARIRLRSRTHLVLEGDPGS